MMNFLFAGLLVIAMSPLLGITSADAQEYPAKPIRIIIPNAAGTTQDLMARAVSPGMSITLGQPVIVENKVGAGQLLGMEYVAKQVPNDGYTIGLFAPTVMTTAPLTSKDLRFDPATDLPPIIGLAAVRTGIVTPTQNPWRNLTEFIAYAKANPGKLNYGQTSPWAQLVAELFLRENGLNVVGVPLKSTGQVMQSLIANDINITFTTIGIGISLGDKARLLAVSGDQRLGSLPNTPTFREVGLPQIRGAEYSMNAPAGTPKPVIDRLYSTVARLLQQPDIRAQYAKLDADISATTPEVTARDLAEGFKNFAGIAKLIGLQPN